MIEITTIIPTVGRKSLDLAIQSALAQNNVSNKIIVVDDSISQNINFSKTSIIRTGGNRGVAFARNLGIMEVKSEWVAILDDDDQWLPNKSVQQIEFMKLNCLDLSLTCALFENQKKIRPKKIYDGCIDPLEQVYSGVNPFQRDFYLPTSSLIIKGNVAKNLSFDTALKEREDLWYLHQAYQLNYRIKQMTIIVIKNIVIIKQLKKLLIYS
jgi:glycosyltransferase involved in cell wall biosynthesis